MALAAGSRLGPYEILAPLGAGGMGEVWRARDTRLDRTVAIKALPADFATDEHMRARLEREARAISALNDPHICTLYDIGQENGLRYLVMEFVDGESLADRLARGPLPLQQILRYGVEIAGALERAHKEGIIHRDLKPANIMIARTGAKLLDFGLAKPLALPASHSGSATKSLTRDGHVVGTLQYMAPEQLEGGEVDHRVDIFALGAVLHEMATGRRVFGGATRAGVMTAILSGEPEPITPPALDRVVRTCLAKDPDARFQSAHDVKVALEWVADDEPRVAAPRRRWAWAAAALLAVLLAATSVIVWRNTRDRSLATPLRLSIVPPPGHQFEFLNGAGTAAISPDGKMIVFPAAKDGVRRLWLRRLGSETAEPLPATEEGANPFWSPDSRSIGFFANEKLMTLRLGADSPLAVCDAPLARGGSWNAEGTIVFAGRASPIMAVPATGSAPPVAVTELDAAKGDTTHRWPFFLPDGRHFLYVAAPSGQALATNSICAGSLDRKMRKVVTTALSQPLFADGYLLFTGRDEKLHAQRFDATKLAVTGEPIALPERQIELDRAFSQSIVSVSPAGTLVYRAGQAPQKTQLIWYSRDGRRLGTVGERAAYASLSLSRDARFVYFNYATTTGQSNIWSYDVETGVKTRLTFGNSRDMLPLVSPDGKRIAYTSVPQSRDRSELRLKDLTTGADTLLIDSRQQLSANDWSPDGRALMVSAGVGRSSALTRVDLMWVTLAERKLRPYLQTPDIENIGRFSPDGKWITYQSDQSGPAEVYLAPFPPTGAKWQLSENGGFGARWRADGKEIYYVAPGGRLMALPITLGASPVIGRARLLFQEREATPSRFVYAATPDGQRFLVNTPMEDEPPQSLTVVLHFDSELRAAARRK